MLRAARRLFRPLLGAASPVNWHALAAAGGAARGPAAVRSADEALTLSPFWRGVRLKAQALSTVPVYVYRDGPRGSRAEAPGHPAARILGVRPNPAMCRATFFDLVSVRLDTDGEFFAQVAKDGAGRLTGLYPVRKDLVSQVYVLDDWTKVFVVHGPGGAEVFTGPEMLHVVGHSRDGVRGVPAWEYAADALGLAKGVQDSANSYYQNAVRPSGYLKYPGRLSDDNIQDIKDYFKAEYAGGANAGKVPLVMDGGAFERFPGDTADAARLVDALGASVDDVARWLGVSPLQLYNLDRGTYSNLAADNAAFVQQSVQPLIEKVELALAYCVFGGGDDPHHARFDVSHLLRGDPSELAAYLAVGVQNGTVTRNEARALQDLPPLPGLDAPLSPLNMGPADARDAADPRPDPAGRPGAAG